MPSSERLTRPIHRRRPVHRLLRQVDGGKGLGAGGSHKDAVAGLATVQGDTPAIGRRLHGIGLGVNEKTGRENGQHCSRENPQHREREVQEGSPGSMSGR